MNTRTHPTIEPFAPHHLERVVDLSLRAWAPVFQGIEAALGPDLFRAMHPDWRVDQAAAVTATCLDPDVRTWVAALEGAAVGFASVKLHAEAKIGEIYMIAVDPAVQRRGVARRLADAAVAHMQAAGMTIAMIDTGGDEGHAPARSTYERLGFQPYPTVKYFKRIAA